MSLQRKRGQPCTVYPSKQAVDSRGNSHWVLDESMPIQVTAAFIPERSARAEVPGQQIINVMRMIVRSDLPNVNLWSRVLWRDRLWDIVSPPAYHGGSRHVRHWSLSLRERPRKEL